MRVLLLLISLLACAFFAQPAAAEHITSLTVTIEIDQTKEGGFWWDTHPMGVAPDPYGSITIPGQKREFTPQENTFVLTAVFNNVDLSPGDPIIFDLADRDRGRVDDVIARGSIRWDGNSRMTTKLGFATITIITKGGGREAHPDATHNRGQTSL